MIRFFGKTNFDFQGKRHFWMTVSALVILIGLVSLVIRGGPNYSIDFTGGLSIIVRINEPAGQPKVTEGRLRDLLGGIDLGESEVKMSRSTEGEDIIIRVKEEGRFKPPETSMRAQLNAILGEDWHFVPEDQVDQANMPDLTGQSWLAVSTDQPESRLKQVLDSSEVANARLISHLAINGEPIWLLTGEGKDAASRVKKALNDGLPGHTIDFRSIERVGPRIGAELRNQAILAVLVALLLIVIYLWWRFELLFGIAAVIALFHDVLITVGLFSILNYEISITVIGAFLTLVGYSLNDTIVVFDRIRENLRRYRDLPFKDVINQSINDTLSRTIITGLTTLFVVVILFFKGGEVLHGFSLALLCGILIGTYSSIYIASPILVEYAERTGIAAGKQALRKGAKQGAK